MAVAGSGERWLCLSWAVPWEWKAGDICERCMGGDSPIGWGGEEEGGSWDSLWASHRDSVDDCDTLGILVARVSSD